jgi:hypothetical protein
MNIQEVKQNLTLGLEGKGDFQGQIQVLLDGELWTWIEKQNSLNLENFENNFHRFVSLGWEMIEQSSAVRENHWVEKDLEKAVLQGLVTGKKETIYGDCSCVSISGHEIYRRQGFNNYWGQRSILQMEYHRMFSCDSCIKLKIDGRVIIQ